MQKNASPGGLCHRFRSRRQSGFTLLELLIAMVIMIIIMVAILNLFDRLNRLSRVQLNLTEMQQGLRIGQRELVHMTRMAGRGGLSSLLMFGTGDDSSRVARSSALQIRNNLPSTQAERVVVNDSRSTEAQNILALEGTDILIIRGVFATPIYVVDTESPADFPRPTVAGDGHRGTVTIRNRTPTGITQDLTPLIDAVNSALTSEALVLVDALNPTQFEVARLMPVVDVTADAVTLTYSTDTNEGVPIAQYKTLSWDGGLAPLPFDYGVSYVALLEEYRYYIREDFAIPGDNTSELQPKLSYARVYPGTELRYQDSDANLAIDIADNIFDLQVALGFDSSADGLIDGQVTELANGVDDDWLFNGSDDIAKFNAGTAPWANGSAGINALHYARITTLARSAHVDPDYLVTDEIGSIEDHDYSASNPTAYNRFDGTTIGIQGFPVDARRYRRQILQTTVDLRNVR